MEPQAWPVVTDTPPQRPIPRMRGGLPVLGQALAFQRDPLTLLEQAWRAHGEVFQFRLGGREVVLFAGPEAHDAYFRAPDDQLSAREVYQFTVPIFGKGVAYDVAPERMAEQLSFLAPLMRDGPMHAYTRLIDQEIKDYTASWGDEGEIDLPVVTNELTVNIASRCLLGEEIRTRLDTGFARLYHDLQRGINTLGFFFPRLPIPGHIQRDRARRQVASLMHGILAERRRTGTRPGDFMQALMEAHYTDGSALGDEEITGLLLTVLFAGQHTSSVLAAWVGIDLLRHRQYLAAVLAEIEAVYAQGETLSLDTLKSQLALEHAVREGERLHPPLILLVRKALGDLEYHGFRIGAGTLAMVSPLLSHRLPTVFKDPGRYDPDRFCPPREEHKQGTHVLIGFGGGRHRCLGMHFAYMQIKALWSLLLSRYDLDLISPSPAPDYGSWVTGPRPPCRVRYRRRAVPLGPNL